MAPRRSTLALSYFEMQTGDEPLQQTPGAILARTWGMGAEASAFDWTKSLGVPLPKSGPKNARELDATGKNLFSNPAWGIKSAIKFHATPSNLAYSAIPVAGPFIVLSKFLEGGSSKASRTGKFNKALNDARQNVVQGLKVAMPAAKKVLQDFERAAGDLEALSRSAEGSTDPQVGEALEVVGASFQVADEAISGPIGGALEAAAAAVIEFEEGAERINPNDIGNPSLIALQELEKKLMPDLRKATASATPLVRKLQQYLTSAKALVERSLRAQKEAERKAQVEALREAQNLVKEAISYSDEAVRQGEVDTAFEILSDQTILDLAIVANMVPTVQGRLESIRKAQEQKKQVDQMKQMLDMFRMYQASRTPGNFAPVSTNPALPAPSADYAYPYPYYPPGYSTPPAAPSVIPLSEQPSSLPSPYFYNDGTVITLADGSRWRNGNSVTWTQIAPATKAVPGMNLWFSTAGMGNTSHFDLAELCSVWSK